MGFECRYGREDPIPNFLRNLDFPLEVGHAGWVVVAFWGIIASLPVTWLLEACRVTAVYGRGFEG